MAGYSVRPLAADTWDDFATLAARHKGVWGGCWCMAFHARGPSWGVSADGNRAEKEALVKAGQAHAALVYADGACIGWCQFGSPAELPRIKNRKAHAAGDDPVAQWRITCFFVDKAYRGQGVAEAALAGALDLIAQAGGGVVESFPEDVEGRNVSPGFLWNAGAAMFERQGFIRLRMLGKRTWLMQRDVTAV